MINHLSDKLFYLIKRSIYLQRVLAGKEMNDFERVFDDTNGHQFLAIVATVHHERIRQALHDRALKGSIQL